MRSITGFDVPVPLPADINAAIKRADRIAAYFEATRLAGFTQHEAETYFAFDDTLPSSLQSQLLNLTAQPAHETQISFLSRFHQLASTA